MLAELFAKCRGIAVAELVGDVLQGAFAFLVEEACGLGNALLHGPVAQADAHRFVEAAAQSADTHASLVARRGHRNHARYHR